MTADIRYDAQFLREFMARVEQFMQVQPAPLVRVDFANLLTNGTFDADSDWTKGTGWTIAAGVATHAAGASSSLFQKPNSIIKGRNYRVGVDLTVSAGTVELWLGNSLISSNTATGSYSGAVVSNGSTFNRVFLFGGSTFSGTGDNISVWEADPSDDAPWLRLPFGHKIGKHGMIIRDGDVLHPADYEEITDSGQTFIKPIVAPGASTEFSIWCAPEGLT